MTEEKVPLMKTEASSDSEYCTLLRQPRAYRILKEISRLGFSASFMSYDGNESKLLQQEVEKARQERMRREQESIDEKKEELRKHEDDLLYAHLDEILNKNSAEVANRIAKDKKRMELRQTVKISMWESDSNKYSRDEDLKKALEKYQLEGYITVEKESIKITPKGSKLLARCVLEEVLQKLKKKGIGAHQISEVGVGSQLSSFKREYEIGDEYDLVDLEGTLLSAAERGRSLNPIRLEPRDFQIYESLHQSAMCVGLLMDYSGSMGSNNKIDAAIDISLALSELITTEYPRDKLKVYLFAEEVKEIKPYDIVNIDSFGGMTDIRSAMQAFREATEGVDEDKQAYLITDTEPNFEYGHDIGFDKAVDGVIKEAINYKNNGITLNIIMLDRSPTLREFARILAKENVGRVFYTSPKNLSNILLEDYIISKRARLHGTYG